MIFYYFCKIFVPGSERPPLKGFDKILVLTKKEKKVIFHSPQRWFENKIRVQRKNVKKTLGLSGFLCGLLFFIFLMLSLLLTTQQALEDSVDQDQIAQNMQSDL